jgi:hypothetical protein
METLEIENKKKPRFRQARLKFKLQGELMRLRKNCPSPPGLPSCLPLRPTNLLSFRCYKKISIKRTFPKIS